MSADWWDTEGRAFELVAEISLTLKKILEELQALRERGWSESVSQNSGSFHIPAIDERAKSE